MAAAPTGLNQIMIVEYHLVLTYLDQSVHPGQTKGPGLPRSKSAEQF